MRRFHFWQFSLASLLLKDETPAAWATDYLNRIPTIRGALFRAEGDKIEVRRSRKYPLGHYDEIGRWSFKYRVGYRLNREADRLLLWVYNYRKEADLEQLPPAFR